jgi:hypothetical protein
MTKINSQIKNKFIFEFSHNLKKFSRRLPETGEPNLNRPCQSLFF